MVDEESQTSSEKSENYSRFKESNETRHMSTKKLKRLVLLEQLSLILNFFFGKTYNFIYRKNLC
ncbi:hypothetical protein PUN28_014898 [Cardiocondyla obscurior]|uniref:Uncharacterized protein n=1 Tax=Cardiocondyla obscurior TaxID=286306 RepID=A0AAW2F133_9HYME